MKKALLLCLAPFFMWACSSKELPTEAKDDITDNYQFGEFTYDKFTERTPAIPLFEHVGNEYDILAIGNSPKSRVMRTKDGCGDVMEVFFKVMCNGTPCEGYPVQSIKFYPFEEYYQTQVNAPSSKDYDANHDGHLLVFVEEIEKAGFYSDVQVFVMPKNSKIKTDTVMCTSNPKYEL